MKPAWILLALASCTAGGVNVELHVYPDGSGTYAFVGARPAETVAPEGLIEGARDVRAIDVTVRIQQGRFESVEKLRLGDISIQWSGSERSSKFRMTVPTTSDAKWYRELGLTRPQRDLLAEVARKSVPQEEPLAVVLAVGMPGVVTKNSLVHPAPAWKLGAEDRSGQFGSEDQKNTAVLSIPVDEILAGTTREVVWEVECGPVLDRVREAWKKADPGLRVIAGHKGKVVPCIAFSPDGRRLASGGWDRTIKLWDLGTGKEEAALAGHKESVYCLAWSPDGTRLASSGMEEGVRMWEVSSGRQIRTIASGAWTTDLAFSPDGQVLYTAGAFGGLRAFNPENGKEDFSIAGCPTLALAPDGRILAAGDEKRVLIIDPKTGRMVHAFEGHKDSVDTLAFAPDGKWLASGGDDNTVRIWDLETRKALAVLNDFREDITGVRFAPDGKRVLAASLGQKVRVFELPGGKEVRTLDAWGCTHRNLVFSPDGKTLGASLFDGQIKLWAWR